MVTIGVQQDYFVVVQSDSGRALYLNKEELKSLASMAKEYVDMIEEVPAE